MAATTEDCNAAGVKNGHLGIPEAVFVVSTCVHEWRWARCYAGFAAGLEYRTRERFPVGAVTLDPETAHGRLVLSADGRSVSLADRVSYFYDMPKRFNHAVCVLGREGLSSGRHYWEVEVGDFELDLGVCDESASRKGEITVSPEKGYWAVWVGHSEYQALTSPSTSLTPSIPPKVVGLLLDFEENQLSVYNVTDRSLLFTFSADPFPKTLRPFFRAWPNDEGKNGGAALRILPVMEED